MIASITIKQIEVGEVGLLQASDGPSSIIYAVNLYENIALKFVVPEQHIGGIAVNADLNTLSSTLTKYLSTGNIVDITVVGGDNTDTSTQYEESLRETLKSLDVEYHGLISTTWDVNLCIHNNGVDLTGEELA